MMRPGLLHTVVAIALAIATAIVTRATASEAITPVTQLMAAMLVVFVASLVLGLSKSMASATVPLLAAIVVESGFAGNASWIRSLAIGCLWFVTVEMGWEAIDRRDGSVRTRVSTITWVQEVVTVTAVALGIGLLAVIAIEVAPERTLLLQAGVLGLVLVAFITLIRGIAVSPTTDEM